MAVSLQNLVRKKADKPPKIAIYGPSGVGKTTLAAGFPDPVFIQTEDGAGMLEITSFTDGPMTSYNDVDQALQELATEDHNFKTLVIDSVTRLEPLIWGETKARNNITDAKEFDAYGRGYAMADEVWREFLIACTWLRDNKDMCVVFLGHEAVTGFSDPTTESYDRYTMRLHKRAEAIVREDMDVVGFLNQVTTISKEKGKFNAETAKAKGSGQRMLNVAPRPAFQAKNRFSMPDQILINPGEGFTALAPHMPGFSGKTSAQAA